MYNKKLVVIICFFLLVFGQVWKNTYGGQIDVMSESKKKHNLSPSSPHSVVITGNQVIQVQAEKTETWYIGCFNIGTVNNIPLTFNFPSFPYTSHTNFYIDGNMYSSVSDIGLNQMNVKSSPDLVGNTIICSWEVQNVTIEQRLTPEAYSVVSGAIFIQYVLTNNDVSAHDVGLLLELDTKINNNDFAPIFTRDTYGTTEMQTVGSDVPDNYLAWERNDFNNPGLIVQGSLRGRGAVAPDVFIVGDWTRLNYVQWDYDPIDIGYGDSALLLRWNPVRLAPGESRTIGTYFGITEVEISTGILNLLLYAPLRLDIANDHLSPNPFDVNLLINNSGSQTAQDVETTIILPDYLILETPGNETKSANPSDIQPNNSATVTWRASAEIPPRDITVPITVVVTSSNTDGNNVTKQIFIPTNVVLPDTASIYPSADTPQMAGDEFWVDICVGDSADPVRNLYGSSFVLHYDTNRTELVRPLTTNIERGDFIGNSDEVVFLHTPEGFLQGDSIGLAVTRTVTGTKSGWGPVLRVKFKTNENTPDTTICFTITSAVANDSAWNPIVLIPHGFCIEILGWRTVWPGDTNNDGIVNQADLLPIGICWGKTGYPRTGYVNLTEWEAQKCRPWSPDVRATYTDAYGDGMVDELDILVIGLNNWHQIHSIGKRTAIPILKTGKGGILKAVVFNNIPEGYIDVGLIVSDVEHLLGMGIKFLYPSKEMKVVSVEPGKLFERCPLFLYRNDASSGIVGIGISRTVQQGGISGSGCVAKIRLKVENEQSISRIDLGRVMGMDGLGNVLTFVVDGSLSDYSVPGDFNLFQNYPNPFNPQTTIRYELPVMSTVTLKVYDLLGAEVVTLVDEDHGAGRYEVIWDGRNDLGEWVATGLYYFKLQAGELSCVKKCLFIK